MDAKPVLFSFRLELHDLEVALEENKLMWEWKFSLFIEKQNKVSKIGVTLNPLLLRRPSLKPVFPPQSIRHTASCDLSKGKIIAFSWGEPFNGHLG